MQGKTMWLIGGIAVVALMFFVASRFGVAGSQVAADTTAGDAEGEPEYKIVSLLPPDTIRSIDNPQFVSGEEANNQYGVDEVVLGIEIDGDARAYSVPFLSGHEIVNDVVGGEPIAVTW